MKHKTKEEILIDKYSAKVMNWEDAFRQNPLFAKAAHEAMDEYSKQECIGLIQFMYASCAETIPNTRPAKWNIDLNTQVTFEQLYNLYLQSKL